MKKLKPLTEKMDLYLMMYFREKYWDLWVNYCRSEGYEARLED